MMALSLWQPWATLWLNGPKIHETQPKPFSYRGWLAVHAAKRKPDPRELPPDLVAILEQREGLNWRWRLPLGQLLGAVYIEDSAPTEVMQPLSHGDLLAGNWQPGRYAVRRSETDVIKLETPRDLIGRQGRFYLPDDLADWFDFYIIKNDLRDTEKIANARQISGGDIRDLIRNGTRDLAI
jgi:hypothetical protein